MKLRCYTVRIPGLGCSSISVIAVQYGFFIPCVTEDYVARQMAAALGISDLCLNWSMSDSSDEECKKAYNRNCMLQVNKNNGSNLSFRKLGAVRAWKMALLLAGWVQPPRPSPKMTDVEAVKKAVDKLQLPRD